MQTKSIPTITPKQLDRFWSKVDVPLQISCCWEWTACRLPTGYGRVSLGESEYYAHRVSYTVLMGPIESNMVIDHLCRNPPCVNPDHMQVVTMEVNSSRGRPSITIPRLRYCKRGHEFTIENTYVFREKRRCLECQRNRARHNYLLRTSHLDA